MPKLKSNKQEAFAQHYALHGKPTAAYRHAYNAGNMKAQTIAVRASELLRDSKVAVRIEELQAVVAEQAEQEFKLDAHWLLRRLHEVDSLDVADLLDERGCVKPVSEWPKAWRTSISGLDVHELMTGDIETIIRKVKMPDKLKNLELIGRHVEVQAFKDKVEVSADKSLAELLAEVREES